MVRWLAVACLLCVCRWHSPAFGANSAEQQEIDHVGEKEDEQILLFRDLFAYSGPGGLFSAVPETPSTLLEVTPGSSALMRWLKEQAMVSAESHGFDLSGFSQCQWRQPPSQEGGEGVPVHDSDCAMPFANDAFDLVYSYNHLEFVQAAVLPLVISELVRVSKGRIVTMISLQASDRTTTVASRGWWDDQFAEAGCVVDLDLLGYLWHELRDYRPVPWEPYASPFVFAYFCSKAAGIETARAQALSQLDELRMALEAGEGVCGERGWCDLFDPGRYWATGFGEEAETKPSQSSVAADTHEEAALASKPETASYGFALPGCWARGLPLEAQGEDCLWVLGWWRPHRELVYTREELDVAKELFAHDKSRRWADIRQTLPHRGSGASPSQLGSCAVVGSSWVLSGAGLGGEIDSHDAVFRINDAPVEGFEVDVGHKTTHRVVEPACFQEKPFPRDLLEDSVEVLLRLSAAREETVGQVLEQFADSWAWLPARCNLISRSFVDDMQERCADDPLREWQLTTGLLSILLAVHACPAVDTYGFGGGIEVSADGRSARYKYWDTHRELQTQVLYPWHGWERENDLHNRFEQAKLLRRRFGPAREHLRRVPGGGADSVPGRVS